MTGRAYAAVFALVGWFAVIGQYAVSYKHDLVGTVDFLSYFTTLSNILVALTLTVAALAPGSGPGRFLLRPSVAMATAVYITVTGFTYYLILAKLYDLHGWTLVLNHLLHYVMPPAYVVFWLAFVRKGTLHLPAVGWMLVPPLGYAAYTLVHGPFSGFYPYPFVDVTKIGYVHVLANIGKFIVLFSLFGFVFLGLDKAIGRLVPGSRAP
ncbi:MAG TPA: Pr6Pr family membrane protein [Bauldia sp.]|nr:Pr6Pr family membrane protein [Bauldia sp.]